MLSCVCALAASGPQQTPAAEPSTKRETTTAQTPHKAATASARKKTSSHAGSAKAAGSAHTTAVHSASKGRRSTSRNGKTTTRTRGQQKIDSDRVHAIQEALIREHYLTG
jgi:hypothetical protein